MRNPLEGCWAKWEQGKRHLDALHSEVETLIAPLQGRGVPFEIHHEPQSMTSMQEVATFFMPETPTLDEPMFALMVGDILNCYRGALDHLAWYAVKRLGTSLRNLKRRERRRISFPLARSWKTYPQAFGDSLRGIDPTSDFGRLVKSYQACGRGQRASAMRAALRDLGDRDKHRLLIPTFWYPEGIEFDPVAEGVSIVRQELLVDTSRRIPFKSHKPLLRIWFVPTSVFLHQPKLELKANATFQPALGGSWWMMPTLHGIGHTVGALLYEATPILLGPRA